MESVYSAVRTDSFYNADYVWSLNNRGGKCLQRGTDWFLIHGGAKRTHVFQRIVTLFIFNIKKMLTTKQPVINAVWLLNIDYAITENYRVAQKERIAFRRCPLAPTLTRFICVRFLSLGLSQIKSLRSKTSYSRRSESFHSHRNCNCATRNVSKCDAEL